ncbi:hypothetical protein BJY01DRAFT_255753 [Aspergillus pseudoustus]|uniref:Uncharacterized protein n=1 Tax=Aspergillus pseudoustus TaxID=1810923 RepID=A0ABR4IHP4_9EURO
MPKQQLSGHLLIGAIGLEFRETLQEKLTEARETADYPNRPWSVKHAARSASLSTWSTRSSGTSTPISGRTPRWFRAASTSRRMSGSVGTEGCAELVSAFFNSPTPDTALPLGAVEDIPSGLVKSWIREGVGSYDDRRAYNRANPGPVRKVYYSLVSVGKGDSRLELSLDDALKRMKEPREMAKLETRLAALERLPLLTNREEMEEAETVLDLLYEFCKYAKAYQSLEALIDRSIDEDANSGRCLFKN